MILLTHQTPILLGIAPEEFCNYVRNFVMRC